MQMVGLEKTIDQLAIDNSVCWYGNVLRNDKNNILRKVIFQSKSNKEDG